MAWATLTDVRRLWPDASVVDDETLTDLMGAAERVCVTFGAPDVVTDPAPRTPEAWRP